ncbi:unnamed protein product [Meganyctiphanes norvegica]|uniref:Uncharacterized protein n=1 Tax=Meganyctiphanes norvegica TaxID=48144 RepID=A0AAV2R510_MEGNR
MNGMFQHILGVVLISSYALASTDDSYSLGGSESLHSEEPRIFFGTTGTTTTGSFVTFNSTLLLFSAGIALLGLAGAVALFFLLTTPEESSSYSNSGYSDSGSGYEGYEGRSNSWKFNPYGINWESLSILDWISMGQEAWDKFDPASLECQKRLICEIHQNKNTFGGPANTMVELFGYLHYAEILSLPDELKIILEEYMDASEKGRTMQKDCGEVFTACDFSMNGILSKFSTNKI